MKFWGIRLLSIILVIAVCFGIQAIADASGGFISRVIVVAGLYVTLAVSLNLINGITGQFSIGHAAFYQVGAYVAGYVTVRFYDVQPLGGIGWLLVMMIVGGIAAAIAGIVVGLPSLRLRGDYLAIVTLGFGEIIRIISINIDEVGGSYGFNIEPKIREPWMIWLLAFICIAVCRNLLKTAHGLPFLAVREDEVASQAMGVNTTRVKVTAFIIGSAFAGMAGALLAHNDGFVTPDMFKMEQSFIILTMVVLGGTGSITGSTLAAIFLIGFPEYLRDLKDASGDPLTISGPVLAGIAVAAIMLVSLYRRIQNHYHGPHNKRLGLYLGGLGVSILSVPIVALVVGLIPTAAAKGYEINSLRMVFFAAILIILMLLRPQGVLGHHELSLNWLAGLFGIGKKKKQEASA